MAMAYNQENFRKITYKGKVTNANYSLCYFEMDDILNVYGAEFTVHNFELTLPLINETIILKNALIYDRTTLILSSKSKIINSNNEDEESQLDNMLSFKEFYIEFDLKAIEYIRIKAMHDKLIDFEVGITKDNAQYTQIDITSLLLEVLGILVDNDRNCLIDIIIKLPRDFKISPETNQVQMAPYNYWQAGTHRSTSNDVLIGLLNISNTFGYLMLSDTAHELPIIIAQNDNDFIEKLSKLLNHFVCIKNYIQFSEYYKKAGEINFIYADIDDIELLEIPDEFMIKNTTEEVLRIEDKTNSFRVKFYVISKSSIIQKKETRYFFMRVKYKIDSDDVKRNIILECIFQVNEGLLHLYPILLENNTYCFYTNCGKFADGFIKQNSETIFTIFQKRLQSYNIPLDTKLKIIKEDDDEYEQLLEKNDKTHIHTVQEAKSFLKTTEKCVNRKLITVEGIITNRAFFSPLKKPLNEEFTLEPFGIPGNKVHNITIRNDLKTECEGKVESFEYFIYEDDENYQNVLQQYFEGTFPETKESLEKTGVELVNIFMHNFTHLQCPLGLVPEMRVLFKNLTAVKGKYFKPTIFTCIDVISYEPLINYSSANSVLGNIDWGPSISLGSGNSIPTNTICWGATIHIKITQLTTKLKCKKCKQEVAYYSDCCCGTINFDFIMSLTLVVRDTGGVSKVTTSNSDVLRVLLDKEENEWSLLIKNLKMIKNFTFKDYEMNEEDEMEDDLEDDFFDDKNRKFSNTFILVLRAWNEVRIHHFDLKCRKMENREKNPNHLPFWWCLEVRRSFTTETSETSEN